jgi:putative membrane protein
VIGPHFDGKGKFKVWSLSSGGNALVITTSAPEFTDDIALEVGLEAAESARSRLEGIKHIAMVDAHNCIDDEAVSVMPGDDEAKTYVSDVVQALDTTLDKDGHDLSIGIHQVTAEDFPAREGLGPGGVTALVFRTDDGDTVFISIDGNNMEPGVREEVQQLLLDEGFTASEVLTTDTHVVNAISLSSKGYPPVGRYRKQQVLDMIITASKEARNTIQSVSVGLGFGEIKGLRTFGEKGFDILTQDIVEAADIAKKTGLRTLAVTFLLTLLLTFLI